MSDADGNRRFPRGQAHVRGSLHGHRVIGVGEEDDDTDRPAMSPGARYDVTHHAVARGNRRHLAFYRVLRSCRGRSIQGASDSVGDRVQVVVLLGIHLASMLDICLPLVNPLATLFLARGRRSAFTPGSGRGW